jgi:large subunit ribosomal protein L23
MRDPRSVLVRPLMTEKSMQQKEAHNMITFEVAVDANKVEIRHAGE